MRSVVLALAFLTYSSLHAAPPSLTCTEEAQTYDSKVVLCAIPQLTETRSYRFIARFSGGHDDTRASIQTSLDGRPLTCEDGSKTESFAEDGDISLNCRFVLSGAPGIHPSLRVTVRWSHAEYTNFDLEGL